MYHSALLNTINLLMVLVNLVLLIVLLVALINQHVKVVLLLYLIYLREYVFKNALMDFSLIKLTITLVKCAHKIVKLVSDLQNKNV